MASPQQSAQTLESDSKPYLYEGATKGISRGMASHLVPKTMWWDALNFRFAKGKITQIASLKPYLSLPSGDIGDVQVVTAVNLNATVSTLVALTPTRFYEIDTTVSSATFVGSDYTIGEPWHRWASFSDSTRFFFTNHQTPVKFYIPGTGIADLVTSGQEYGALYMVNFHNHLVLANLNHFVDGTFPNRIAWSDVSDFTNFLPSPDNESDFFNLEEQAGNAPNGASITGMAKLGNALYIYTSTSIWVMQYVGLPNVMLIQAKMRDVGCYYPYSLASVLDCHYFIGAGGFYTFDGSNVRSFGEAIWEYFINDLNPHYIYQNQLHCIVDYTKHEITWYYHSKASTGFVDKGIVYNLVEDHFYVIEGRGVMASQNTTIRSYTTMDGLSPDTFADLTGSMDLLSGSTPFSYALYGTNNGFIRREVVSGDTDLSDVLPESKPFLETGDIHYGSLGVVKEVNSIRLDADFLIGDNVDISLYGRFYIAEHYKQLPLWDATATYNVGDEVRNNGQFWRKLNTIPYRIVNLSIPADKLGFVYDVNTVNEVQFTSDVPDSTNFVRYAMPGVPLVDGQGTRLVQFSPENLVYAPDYPEELIPEFIEVQTQSIELRTPPAYGAPTFLTVPVTTILQKDPPGTFHPLKATEWTSIGIDHTVLQLSPFGIWTQKQFRFTAGATNQGLRTLKSSAGRVHRWRFTFNGPTNATALQPQGAVFHAFEENVYLSPSEM